LLPPRSGRARIALPLILCLLAGTPVAHAEEAPPAKGAPPAAGQTLPAVDVVVVVAERGAFRIRLDREKTPNHVAAFLSLVATGFYDGLGFHRIIPEYLVQVGDPSSRDDDAHNDGATTPDWEIPAEETDRTHVAGTVSFAWQGDRPGSAGTQWFVSLGVLPALDGHATPIGEVVEGMDVVEAIAQVSTIRNRHPLRPVRIERTLLVPEDEPTPPLTGKDD
jgi:peptidyl-prolyl cis-trans isomerase B (cyclophilin B)